MKRRPGIRATWNDREKLRWARYFANCGYGAYRWGDVEFTPLEFASLHLDGASAR